MDAQELWATKFARRFAEEQAAEEARREQAFLDIPTDVCGEPLRLMTPQDLLILNGINSPFVCPREEQAVDVPIFLWVLHAANDGAKTWRNRRRRDAMIKRVAVRSFASCIKEITDYVDGIFLDAPAGGGSDTERRPLGACFLAPLIVSLAVETGWAQKEIMGTPLPRLFQYRKAIRARELGKEFKDFSPSDRLTGEFLSELNAANAA